MNVKEIVMEYLAREGFDGLCNTDLECGCGLLDDFAPCEEMGHDCQPSYMCNCGSCAEVNCDNREEVFGFRFFSSKPGCYNGGEE